MWRSTSAARWSFPARLFALDAEASVHGDPVEPGAEGALSPEALDVCPNPDPHLLGGVLGIFASHHPRGPPVDEVRIGPDQPRKSIHVTLRSACDQPPVPGTHPWTSPVETVQSRGGRNDSRSSAR